MGMSIESCSCLKNEISLESEFKSKTTYDRPPNLKGKDSILNHQITSPVYTFGEKKVIFSKDSKRVLKNNKKKPEVKIQTVVRAFLFRIKFFKENGIKDNLITEDEKIITKFDEEYISETLLETDKYIKKELNQDFLLKLKLKDKDSNKDINKDKIKVKTKCFVKKYINGELCLYKGELSISGIFNGYGELYFQNGKKYEGKFIDGKLNGYGRLIDLFGIICYEGIFKNNQLLDGKAKIIKFEENGEKTIYEGDIKNMKKEGEGIEKNNIYTYMGSFSDDLKHGKGKIIYGIGDEYYEGDFENGKLTGKGFYQWANKCTYEGEFLDGQMHGKGLYKWPDGDEYESDYINNIKEGNGEFRWKSGKKYKGQVKNGKPNGFGVITRKNGESQEVEVENGKIVNKKGKDLSQQNTFSLKDSDI